MVIFYRLGEPAGYDRLDNLTNYIKEYDRALAFYYLSYLNSLTGF